MSAVFDISELIHAIEPRVFDRARRVRCAIELLNSGMRRPEVSGEIQRRYKVSQPQAWRIVQIALDLTVL